MPLHRSGPRVVGALAATCAVVLSACASSNPSPDRDVAPAGAKAKATLTSVRVSVPASLRSAPFDRARTLKVPRGWHVSVWARIPGARLMVAAPDGRVLVSRPQYGDVQVLTPRHGKTPSRRTLVSGLRQPHGLAFSRNTLYVAESNRIDTFRYAKGRASGRRTLVGGLPDAKSPELGGAYAHALKSVVVGADGSVYFSIGSTGNVSPADRSASPQRASVLRWSPRTRRVTVWARGVRNGTGLALDPRGGLWTAVNNRDQTAYPYHRDYDRDGRSDYGRVLPSYVNDHPIEPLAKLTAGRDLGWPYCNPDPDAKAGVKGTTLKYASRPFIRDVQTNPSGARLNCATLPRIEQGLPAHSAPLGLTFAAVGGRWGTGALVAAHGSWNRTPPRAPSVSFFRWTKGSLGGRQTFVTGWQAKDGSRWGRPVGVVRADRAVLVSDDTAGAIYRLTS